jgi:F-type H+-transporting ATPase subunit b
VAAAAARQTEAQRASDDMAAKLKAFEAERTARVARVTLDVGKEREQLLEAARREGADLVARERQAIAADATSIGDRIARLATDEVFAIAGKAFNELASTDLEERLGSVFTQRLRELGKDANAAFRTALEQSGWSAVIRSRVAMRNTEQATLRNAVNETFAADVHLEFQTVPTGDYGIDLSAGGQRLAWGIQAYLEDFQKRAEALLQARAG